MKKLTRVLVSVVAAAALCFAAVACGEVDEPKTPDQPSTPGVGTPETPEQPGTPGNPETPVTYTVTYNLDGGTGTLPTESAKEAGAKFNLASGDGLTKAEFTFDGWSDGASKYAAGAEYTMPANNVTLTAQWKANGQEPPETPVTYTVTYNLDGGEGTLPTESAKEAGAKFNLASGDGLTKAEFIFDGWSDGSSKYAAGAEYTMPASNVTFTAQWKANEQEQPPEEPEVVYSAYELDYKGVIVLYDNNKGELMYADSLDVEKTAAFSYTVTGTTIVINIGGADFTGTYNGNLLTINFTYASTLYRFGEFIQEELVPPTFTYDANGGSGSAPTIPDSDITYNANAELYKVKLPQNTFTPPQGKEFDKWAVDAENNTYGAGKTFMADPGKAYKLIAIWKDSAAAVVVPTGTEFNGNCKTPTKTQPLVGTVGGETVVKIYVDNAEPAIFYVLSTDDTVYKAKNVGIILDKKWMPNLYGDDAYYYECKIETVTYYIVVSANMTKLTLCDSDDEPLDNGEFTAAGGSVVVPTDKTLADYQGTYSGAISFDGDDYDKAVINGTTLSLQEAAYAPSNFALVEDTTGEKLVAVSTKTVMGTVTTITLTFNDDNSFTIEYVKTSSIGGSTTASGSFTRTSQPEPTTEYTVTFDPNNGVDEAWTVTVQSGEKVSKPVADPVNESGKAFRYWRDDDTSAEYDFNGNVTGDVYLTAVYAWKVTFSAGEGTGEIAPLWITTWSPASIRSLPDATGLTCEGKTFAGWNDGTETYQPGDSYYVSSGNVTLTAQWADAQPAQKYTVTYVKTEGVDGALPEAVSVEENSQVTLAAANTFTKAGWTFKGWSVTGYSVLRAQNTAITVNQNTTVTPVFGADYIGDYGKIEVRDNNTLVMDGEIYGFTRSGDIVTIDIDGYMMTVKANDAAKTYKLSDGMDAFVFTAANGATLAFDGFGNATLGTHKGTYTLASDGSAINLVFGGNTYSNVAFAGEYPNLTINVKITIDGTDYVFGNAGTNPENPPEGPTGYLKEYVGASSASSDAVVFGYASAADAEAANDAIKLMNNTSNAERVFYKATVNRNYSNKLTITIAANVGSVSSPKNAENQDIVIDDNTPNQIVYITNASYTDQFVIVFGKNSDGKRTITITNGDITVTWVEVTA